MVEQLTPGNNSPELLVVGYDDMLWISLLDWIPEPKGFVVQTRKRLDITSQIVNGKINLVKRGNQ